MLFANLAFILPIFQYFLLKGIFVFSHKMVFTENEAELLCVTMRQRARAFAATIKFSFCGTLFKRILAWNEAFPKGSS